jgi:hypothetical protein
LRVPQTPATYDDVTPIARGEWNCLMRPVETTELGLQEGLARKRGVGVIC